MPVELWVNGVVDLPAADAQYQTNCYNDFRKHGSSELVQNLNEHGIVTTYDEVLRFQKSAAKYASEDPDKYLHTVGLEKRIGPIHSWGDNFDLVVFTPNGCCMTHALATPPALVPRSPKN
ncbi:hypothetical protein AAFF_G00223060 [Aldrovandia affinis]|uniref:Uncharacterized protein n=1 Tax=Aldrovandia affinis TaxID=143900 RepID=A0AAD7RF93_9TELE|nr:hypothetical protein AAFF_G00223060 [Aldrovandia affinis]